MLFPRFKKEPGQINRWALNNVPDSFPVIDGLLAATAIEHDLIFVTRNIKDVKSSDVQLLNPFL